MARKRNTVGGSMRALSEVSGLVALALILSAGARTTDWISTAAPGKRIGIIGLDTSHAPAFTRIFNAPAEDFGSYRVVAAYPQGSPDIEASTSRVAGYVAEMRGLGVEIVDSIPALIASVFRLSPFYATQALGIWSLFLKRS